MPETVLKCTLKPKNRDLTNITPDKLLNLDPSHEIVTELGKLEKVTKNRNMIEKVYRALNNFVRMKLENQFPDQAQIKAMIDDSKEEKDEKNYNPVRCWRNDDEKTEIRALIEAIAQINIDSIKKLDMQVIIKKRVLSDPYLNSNVVSEYLDMGAKPRSLSLL